MWDILHQPSFILGAVLILIFQTTKFRELNLADPTTSRYVALFPGATVQDFAGFYAYHLALASFLSLSLITYFLLCQISPNVFDGALKYFAGLGGDLAKGGARPEVAKEASKQITHAGELFPLYVAALFVGASQPIPLFSRVGDAQRNFFHRRIEVPRRVIDFCDNLINAMAARSGANKQALADEITKLASADFQHDLHTYGDAAFYRTQLEKLQIGDDAALKRTIRDSSIRELRALLERLTLYALVAAMRRSGPKSLSRVATLLGVKDALTARREGRYFFASFMASGFVFSLGLLFIAYVFTALDTAIPNALGQHPSLWPIGFSEVGWEFLTIVPPMIASLVIAISFLASPEQIQSRPRGAEPSTSMAADFIEFFRSAAPILGVCIIVAALIKFGLMFNEFKFFLNDPNKRSLSLLVLPIVQAFIPAGLCLFTTWYLMSSAKDGSRRALSFNITLVFIAIVTVFVSFLYSQAFVPDYVRRYSEFAPSWDYAMFMVAANVAISLTAFVSVALFFETRDHWTRAAHTREERDHVTPDREPSRPRRALRNAIAQVNARVGVKRRARR